jgi:uncharacterized protein (TIGR02996 family)
MSSEHSFLAHIAQNPEDRAARLVYADWLEERGDPRAQLLRVHEEMLTLPVYDDRYWELKGLHAGLTQKAEPAWVKAVDCGPAYRPLFTHIPPERAKRWRLVDEFIDHWYGWRTEPDGFSETDLVAAEKALGFALPMALREWYLRYGKRDDVWSKQDRLCLPGELGSSWGWNNNEDALIFYCENQACDAWGIRTQDLKAEDPPVYRFDGGPMLVSPTTSMFAIMILLHEVKFATRSAWGEVTNESAAKIAATYSHAGEVPESYWVGEWHRFFEGRDLIIHLSGLSAYVTPRTEEAFQRVDEMIRGQLDRD